MVRDDKLLYVPVVALLPPGLEPAGGAGLVPATVAPPAAVRRSVTKEFTEEQQCPIGSIKSNVGHLESAVLGLEIHFQSV